MAFAVTELISGVMTITPAGGTFEVEYLIKNRDCNAVVFYLNYTKNTSTYITIAYHTAPIKTRAAAPDYYQETIIDLTKVPKENDVYSFKHLPAGKTKIVFETSRGEKAIKLVLTPDAVGGTDTLVLHAEEDSIHGMV